MPTIRTFQEIAEPPTLEAAKKATGAVLTVLQELFEASDKVQFTAAEVKTLVTTKTSGSLSDREIDIGLYLSTEFNYLGSYGHSQDGTTLLSIGPHENIIHFTSIEEDWARRVALLGAPPVGHSTETDWSIPPSLDNFGLFMGDSETETTTDRRFALMAIEEARKSAPEDERPHPKVGAVVVKNGSVLSAAHRGETAHCHAEYIALEKKLPDDAVAGATVYTTLEPCTTRNHPKIPCAERLIERKVKCVVMGMLDTNPDIRGRGWQLLRDAGVETRMFDHDLMLQIEDLNREFSRAQKQKQPPRNIAQTAPRIDPNLMIYGFAYPDIALHADGIWRHDYSEGTRKGLVLNIRNDTYEDGTGIEGKAIRAQLFFEYDKGIQGPSFSPLPWVSESYGMIDIPVGTQKQVLIGVKCSSGGWMGYANTRLNSTHAGEKNAMLGDYLPDRPVTMTLVLIADVFGHSKAIFKAYFDWKVDYSSNHPSFSQKPAPRSAAP